MVANRVAPERTAPEAEVGNDSPDGGSEHDRPAPERIANDRLTPWVLEVSDAVGAFIETWGFRAIHGRVWTLLALQRRPVAQAEVASVLGVSRSLISLAIAELTAFGLVRAVGTQRNAPYEASLNVWPTISNVLRAREWMLIETARVALSALVQEARLVEEQQAPTGYDLPRMRLLLLMTELAQASLRAVLALQIPASFEGFAGWLERARGGLKLFTRPSRWTRTATAVRRNTPD